MNVSNVTSKGYMGHVTVGMQVGLTLFGTIAFIISLVGNTVVIHIVRTRRHMRGTTNILISNMSIADILITFVYPYVLKFYFVGANWFGGVLGTVTCKTIHSLQMLSICCSVYTLLVISVDRFVAVMMPMKRLFTTRVTIWCVVAVWFVSIIISLPLVIACKVVLHQGNYLCIESWDSVGLSSRGHILTFTFLTFVFPMIFISVAYGISGYKLWGSTPPGQQNDITRKNNKTIIESRRRATKMLITVVILFALCWLPFNVRELIRSLAPQLSRKIPPLLEFTLPWFGFINSALNPIVYIVFSETFRREFQRTLCFWRSDIMSDLMTSCPPSPSVAAKYNARLLDDTRNGGKNGVRSTDTCL